MARTSVADVIADGLARAGASWLFGVDNESDLAHVSVAAARRGLRTLTVEGAASACVMGAVVGDLTGAPGAAVVAVRADERGVLQGLAQARADRSPLVLITDAASEELAAGAKASIVVEPPSVGHWIAHAVRLAVTEPRGPVHLVLAPGVPARAAVPVAASCRPDPLPVPDARALEAAARRLREASQPVLIVGIAARSEEVAKWLRALAEALPAPVLVTPKAKGVFPDPHPLHLGLWTGDPLGNPCVSRADLLVTLGIDDAELVSGSWPLTAPMLHLGPASREVGSRWSIHLGPAPRAAGATDLTVTGDVALIIEELAPQLRGQRADWDVAELDRWKRSSIPPVRPSPPGVALSLRQVLAVIRELTPAGTVAAVEGLPAAATAAWWPAVAPGELLIPNGGAGVPYAVPAVVAAQLRRPDRHAVCFVTADRLAQSVAALQVAARLALPITVVALNEAASAAAAEPLAVAARSAAVEVTTVGDEATLRRAIVDAPRRGPALLDVRIDAATAAPGSR